MADIEYDRECPLFVHRFGGPHCLLSIDSSILKRLTKPCPTHCALRERVLDIPGQRDRYEARKRSLKAEECDHFA